MARNTAVQADLDAPPITLALARFVATHPSRGWDDALEAAARRPLLNWLGCAIGAAHHEAPAAALAACQVLQSAPQAAVLGRRERVDVGSAALINGISSHTFDFDDTHLKTIIHPAGPVASAIVALAELTGVPGRTLIDARVLGIDVSCRMGHVVYPEHDDRGGHITGSTGMLGAAAGCARLLGLDERRTQMALGIAASQPVGLREQFGSMTNPLHPGAAARAGLMSALLARQGYTASPRALEAPRGFAQVVSTKYDWAEATVGLGERFEIALNTFKPFACGIVIHPSIDACVQLREQGVTPEQVERIELKVHSLVPELTGKTEPADGLQAKFSVYYGRPDLRPRRRGRVLRCRGHARRRRGAAPHGGGDGGRRHRRGLGRRHGRARRRPARAPLRRTGRRLAGPALERHRARCQVPRAARPRSQRGALCRAHRHLSHHRVGARPEAPCGACPAKFKPQMLIGAALPACSAALAQDAPSKPVRTVVLFAPGGAVDGPTRAIAEPSGQRLKQQVVIENKPGRRRRHHRQRAGDPVAERDHPDCADRATVDAFADAILALDDSLPNGTDIEMCSRRPVVDPEKIRVPTVVLRGQFDGIAGSDDLLEFFKRLPHPDMQFTVMIGISHASFQQKNHKLVYPILHAYFTQPAPAYTDYSDMPAR
jgi:2-methylcitrate dehydratase PrpD